MTDVLVAKGISLVRAGREIVGGVELTLRQGRMLAILGPNGAGKSSLLRVLAGEIHPDRGEIRLDGIELSRISLPDLARRRGFLRQRFSVAADLSVEELIRLGRMPHVDGRAPAGLISELLEEVGLTGFASRRVATLSGGEQQRAHLARVLAQLSYSAGSSHTPILLLDEPSASLDPKHQLSALTIVKRRCLAGFTVAVVLHDLDLAVRFADDLLILARTPIYCGPTELLSLEHLRQAFGLQATRWVDPNGQARLAWIV